ncbi:MAG: hypothetical protein AB7G37_00825 [Solirubrobacteraceae bacterium]
MSVASDIRRALRPAALSPDETKTLFRVLGQLVRDAPHTTHSQGVEIPSLTESGHAYILTVYLRGGRIHRFEVDHDPDLESPAWQAYATKRAEWEAEIAARKDGAA